MNNNNLKILFVLDKLNFNTKKGIAPLRCRITYKGKRKVFSESLFITPDYWKSKQQKAHPPNKENDFINTQISLITQKVNQAFLFLQVNNQNFDVEDIYLQYKGKNTKTEKTVLEVFQIHNDKVEKLIGKEYVLPTLWKFKQAKNLLKDYIKHQYNKNDYLFKELDLQFIKNYEFYLKTEKNLAQSSTFKAIQRFRKIIKIAIAEGYLDKDPFILYKVKRPKSKIVYLNIDELNLLEQYNFQQTRLQQVKDMFVFCCYTGLAFTEMVELEGKHIVIGFDGNKWLKIHRKKTNTTLSIPLLSKALEMIAIYQDKNKGIFPKISNQKFNSYIKEIAEIVGLDKRLTHHIARKTFATTVLLYNDVPMEIVSELLGHSKITITQEHYAKVVQKKVGEQMVNLNKRLNNN